MKCRDCCHRGWGDDEGTPVYGFCIMRGSCPDPDIERSCPYFEHKAVYIATSLHPVSREQLEKVWESCEKCKCCPNCIYYPSAGDWPCQMCDKHQYFEPRNFCSFCGKPLTDEAVQIRLKELEALKDGSTTD